jgi:hypothetical protein
VVRSPTGSSVLNNIPFGMSRSLIRAGTRRTPSASSEGGIRLANALNRATNASLGKMNGVHVGVPAPTSAAAAATALAVSVGITTDAGKPLTSPVAASHGARRATLSTSGKAQSSPLLSVPTAPSLASFPSQAPSTPTGVSNTRLIQAADASVTAAEHATRQLRMVIEASGKVPTHKQLQELGRYVQQADELTRRLARALHVFRNNEDVPNRRIFTEEAGHFLRVSRVWLGR